MSMSYAKTCLSTAKQLIVFSVFLSFLVSTLTLGQPVTTPTVPTPTLKSESQIKSEAALYDTAIREISHLADIKLAAPENAKTIKATLEKNVPNLRFNRSKLVSLALSDSSLVSAAKTKGNDAKAGKEFIIAACKDSKSVLALPGASSVASRMRSSVDADIQMLRHISDLLRRASDDLKKSAAHHVRSVPNLPAVFFLSDALLTTLVLAAVVIVAPPLLLVLVDASGLAQTGMVVADAAVIAAGGVLLLANLIQNVSTDKGRDKLAQCQDQADDAYRHCVAAAAGLPGLIALAAESLCYTDWLARSAGCLVSE